MCIKSTISILVKFNVDGLHLSKQHLLRTQCFLCDHVVVENCCSRTLHQSYSIPYICNTVNLLTWCWENMWCSVLKACLPCCRHLRSCMIVFLSLTLIRMNGFAQEHILLFLVVFWVIILKSINKMFFFWKPCSILFCVSDFTTTTCTIFLFYLIILSLPVPP